MRLLLLSLCFGTWLLSLVAALPSDRVCVEGTKSKQDCNDCVCLNGVVACTRKGCPLASDRVCVEGTKSKQDCNDCVCLNGVVVCTRKGCLQYSVQQRSITPGVPVSRDIIGECTNGSQWRENCNWCTCSERGIGICTKKGCLSEPLEDEPECVGTARWKKDCNWCTCVEGRGICTLEACSPPPPPQLPDAASDSVDHIEDEGVCTNGSSWREECNWCSCSETGIPMCTIMACPPGQIYDEPECEGTARWKKDCNWCNCVKGRGVCTLKACLTTGTQRDLIQDETSNCVKGSRWKDECNWCSCLDNGGAACTLIGCLPNYQAPADEPQCTDGSRWKNDCNWCECDEGSQICTEIACGIDEEIPALCVEGETFEQDCNTCSCRNGIPVCTLLACIPTVPDDTKELVCQEGASWSEDCNQCRCSNGLKLCTKKLCPQPSLPALCRLPAIAPETPTCAGLERLWTFDSARNKCKPIVYGGCGGTENLFDSESDCIQMCSTGDHALSTGTAKSAQDPALDEIRKRCLLPKQQGPCFGAMPRFFYNKETGNCESFDYGGCQGNDNNFHTAEECQQTCGGVAPSPGESCDRSKCPWKHWEHYLAKGCLPQYDGGICCPTSFLCPSGERSPEEQNKCIYRNKIYDIRATVEVAHDCSASCSCAPGHNGGPEIRCADIECPDLFRPPPPECRRLYRFGECCPYDYDCAGQQTSIDLELRTPTCSWNNETFLEGDQMYFTEHSCQTCICSAAFSGPFGPGCSKVDCGFEFRYTSRFEQGCVPIFFEDGCCPIDWLCPDDSRIVNQVGQEIQDKTEVNACLLDKDPGPCRAHMTRIYYDAEAAECRQFLFRGCLGNDNNFRTYEECEESCRKTIKPSESDRRPDQCHLGAISLEVGKSLEVTNCELECRCITPPEFTCIKHRSCEKLADKQGHKDHPETNCGPECTPIIDARNGSLACSCQSQSFTCPDPDCPPLCETIINYETGCLTCNCPCPLNEEPPCPADCAVVTNYDPVTGCQKCECDPNDHVNPFNNCPEDPPCPADCGIHMVMDKDTGCVECKCDPNSSGNPFEPPVIPPISICPKDPNGDVPCPMDCAIIRSIDEETGCEVCECDPINPGNPFMPVLTLCLRDSNGQAPCPQDCAIIRSVDEETGCEICECDPNDPGNPFVEQVIPEARPCLRDYDGRAPCPQDCAIIRRVDKESGCEICECDPNNPGNPFSFRDKRAHTLCRKDRYGRAPCPQDCAVIRKVDQYTGCEVCECDPDNPGNPFVHPIIPHTRLCQKDSNGRAPCPQDCAVIRKFDERTGCEVCECDPNNTVNPFVPIVFPQTKLCPKDPNGRAPCPQDCAIIRSVDKETGCEVCECDPVNPGNPFIPPVISQCPLDPDGQAPCPQDCAIIRSVDEETGCEVCECDPVNPGNPFIDPVIPQTGPCLKDYDGRAPCPQDCAIIRKVDKESGCEICECDPNKPGNPFSFRDKRAHTLCRKDRYGRAPCPQDCAVIRKVDQDTGCEVCECDPDNPGNPFVHPIIPHTGLCQKDSNGRAPCPQDCAVIRKFDERTGCEVCECDPNNTANPFVPIVFPQTKGCPTDPDGQAPCPQDCAIIRSVDKETGCEVCECDPVNPGNPFVPPVISQTSLCRTDPDGRAPCPQDCAIIRSVDVETGCEVCECDPVNPGNPFIHPVVSKTRPCLTDYDGRAPCPQDCAIIRSVDRETGCEVCECDPVNPGNPFV